MNGRLSCINRDYNAVMNMKKITLSYLKNNPRPQRYRRGFDLDNLKTRLTHESASNNRTPERGYWYEGY
jgi:hypothetical protein